ncbi:MAG: hypothetical protein ISR65_04150 [Bacteriovoracaceae bacterium]|nr:hypothetical protein [Bacteriovoracaceae bacterium]
MIQEIISQIMRHLSLMDRVTDISHNIYKAAEAGDIEYIIRETSNKDRLINIIHALQNQIEEQISCIRSIVAAKEMMSLVVVWNEDLNKWLSDIEHIDKSVISLLEEEKNKTQKEISKNYKTKVQFKGYNLKDVRS